MAFNCAFRRVQEFESESHVWIAFHRLVEAYARTFGVPFREVFAWLERMFGFSRTNRGSWPDLDTMRRAATLLRDRRERRLEERQKLITSQRIAKKGSKRTAVPKRLAELETPPRELAQTMPRVGCWGWRKRRESNT